MQISPCGHCDLEVHWKGNLGNVVLAWPRGRYRAPPFIYYIHALPKIRPAEYPQYKYKEGVGTLNMRSIWSRRREDEEDDLKELYPVLATACEIRLYTSGVASTIVSVSKNYLFVPSGSLG